jgi:CRP-like cAMP-binding protein
MTQDAARVLEALPLFAGVPAESRARLAAAARPVRYAAGAPVFRRGEAGDSMLVVNDGLVRLHLATEAGRELTLGLAGAGEPVGELALIDGGPRSADCTALTPVQGLLLRHADAAPLIRADAALAWALLRALAAKLRRTSQQVEAVGLRPVQARLAAALLRLAAQDPSGLVRLPQGQIAALVAATRPKVNAAIAELRERGLIEQARAGLRLRDPAGLRAVAEEG